MDYYKTLGIDKTASPDEIKKAFRSLASKHHPDKGGDTAKFQEIQEAYATLSDPEKKSQYDNPSPFGNHPSGGWQQADMPQGFEHFFSQFGSNPFGDIFGHQRAARNRSINLQTDITLEDAFTGKEVIASYRLGNGQERSFEVKIPAGVHDGITLRIAGAGEQSYQHIPPGDAMLTVRVLPHPRFQRNNNDLIEQITISVWDALLGKDIEVTTVSGEKLTIKIKEGTQPDAMLRIQGYGMPDMRNPKIRGNHMISIKIHVPTNLTEFQKNTIRSILP
jgi:curved DNA-binding protein